MTAARFRPASLDALSFLLADVRGALGPYLNVFLVSQQHWSQSGVGLVTTAGGILGLAAQIPVGAAIDATRARITPDIRRPSWRSARRPARRWPCC